MVNIKLKDGSIRTYNSYSEMFLDKEAMENWIPPVMEAMQEVVKEPNIVDNNVFAKLDPSTIDFSTEAL